jgi:prolyl-tRNA editing enzyme YbaK/EbsC (Cys-tRNA(Pro) deacylase)
VSKAIDRFSEAARALGLEPTVRRFPEGPRTAEDAARASGCSGGQIVKSLVFVADGKPVIALTSGLNRVDEGRLASALGAVEVRRANADEAREATGFAVGGTPPFGHTSRLRTVMDEDLLDYEEVWAAVGTPDGVFPITPMQLRVAAKATPAHFKQI